MPFTRARVWKASKLIWKSWDQDIIVYNVISGDTHLLSPLAAEALKFLAQPLTAEELASRLAASSRIERDPEITQSVEQLLANLDHLGLIELVTA